MASSQRPSNGPPARPIARPRARPRVRNRKPGTRTLLLATLLVLPLAGTAAVSDVAVLERLLQKGDYGAAYDLARKRRAELEGGPQFDYYYGIAAIETGHLGEAIFALRRVLALRPSIHVRMQLGRAWFLAGEDPLASREFERVLARDPPAPLQARVERYLHALDRRAARYRTAISGHVEVGRGHDSNVTTATDAEAVVIGPLVVALSDESRAQHDEFTRVAGELRISRPLVPGFNLFAELEGERRYHDELTRYETGHGQLRTGMIARGDGVRATLAARGRRFYLGGEPYRDTTGLDASVRYALSEVQVAQVAVGFSRLRHEDRRARDSDLATLVLGTTRLWRVPLRPTLSLYALYGQQHAAFGAEPVTTPEQERMRAAAERDLYGAGTDLRLQIGARWVLRGGLGYRRSDYETDAIFQEARSDEYASADLALQWHPALHWRAELHLEHAENDSNIDFRTYERDVAELAIRYLFQ